MKSYQCHNRPPYRQRIKVADGWWDDGVQRIAKLVTVPFRMAMDCQYTHTALGAVDKSCMGCKHKTLNDGKAH